MKFTRVYIPRLSAPADADSAGADGGDAGAPSRRRGGDGRGKKRTVASGVARTMVACADGRSRSAPVFVAPSGERRVGSADWLPPARPAETRGGASRRPEVRDRLGIEGGGWFRSAGIGRNFRQHGSFR